LFEEINMATMTLRGIDEGMAKMLKELAAKEGMSMNAFILKALREALKLGKKRRGTEYHDLDELAGTWKVEDAVEFEKSTAAFEIVDEGLWK
jgi:plasmid stability protein